MKRALGWLLLLATLAAAAAVVGVYVTRKEPLAVRVAVVAAGTVEETVSSTKAGSVRSRRETDVSVDVAGVIVAIHRREGAIVSRGEALLALDAREALAALEAARQQLRALAAQSAEAAARRAEAERERTRVDGLRAAGIVSTATVDQARSQAEALGAALRSAEARAQAQQGAVAQMEIQLAKYEVASPIDGIVAERLVEEGEWCAPGRVVMRLHDPRDLYVRAELDEVDIGSLRVGLPARVTLDPWRERRLEGRVTRVAPYVSELQEQNRTVAVDVDITEGAEGLSLLPGTSADVEVVLTARPGVLRIPALGLLPGDRVLKVDGDRAREVSVKLGIRNWEYVEVREGLAAGDRIVVSLESEDAKDGARVRVESPGGS